MALYALFKLHALNSPPSVSFQKLRDSNVRFIIKVLAWKRRASLRRLLNGLTNAEYHGFRVDLEFWLDGGYAPEVLEVAEEVEWQFGEKRIHALNETHGVAFLTPLTWASPQDNEYAFFFEDDIAVSRTFFEFCLRLLNEYEPSVGWMGISLTMPRLDELSYPMRLWKPSSKFPDDQLLRFQLPSSWGGLYFPQPWRQFVDFFHWKHQAIPQVESKQAIPDAVSEYWSRSWKRFLIEWMTISGSYLVYPNLKQEASFSVHCREPGEHTGGSGTAQEKSLDLIGSHYSPSTTVPLIGGRRFLAELQLKTFDKIPIISVYHQQVDSIYRLRQVGLWPAEFNEKFLNSTAETTCVLDWALPPGARRGNHVAYRPILDPLHQLAALHNAMQLGKILGRPVYASDIWMPSWNETISLCEFIDCAPFQVRKLSLYGRTLQLRTTGKIKHTPLDAPGEDGSEVGSKENCILPAISFDTNSIKRLFGSCEGPLEFRQLGGVLFDGDFDLLLQAFKPSQQMDEMITSIIEAFGGERFMCVGYAPQAETPCWKRKVSGEGDEAIIKWNCRKSQEEVIERAKQQSELSKVKTLILDEDLNDFRPLIPSEVPEVIQFIALQVCRRADYVAASRVHHVSRYLHRLRQAQGTPVKWIDEEV